MVSNIFTKGEITITVDKEKVAVKMSGDFSDRNPSKAWYDEIIKLSDKVESIVLDLKNCTFMNSSTISQIISLFRVLFERECKMKVIYNKSQKAHSITFETIKISMKSQNSELEIEVI